MDFGRSFQQLLQVVMLTFVEVPYHEFHILELSWNVTLRKITDELESGGDGLLACFQG